MLQNGLLDSTPPILIANPWASGAGNNKLPYYDPSGVAQVADIGPTAPVYLSGSQLRVAALHGDPSLANLGLFYQSCNWPTAATALTATVGPIGRQDSASLASSGTSTVLYQWPALSGGFLDVVCTFVLGATVLQISKRYSFYKTAAGILTVTQIGSTISEGAALAGADVTLASGTGGALSRTITAPSSGPANVYLEVSGSLVLGKT